MDTRKKDKRDLGPVKMSLQMCPYCGTKSFGVKMGGCQHIMCKECAKKKLCPMCASKNVRTKKKNVVREKKKETLVPKGGLIQSQLKVRVIRKKVPMIKKEEREEYLKLGWKCNRKQHMNWY